MIVREFFKPWRRKAGVVTLLMACVFTAAWVRGFQVQDNWCFRVNLNRVELLTSSKWGLMRTRFDESDGDQIATIGYCALPADLRPEYQSIVPNQAMPFFQNRSAGSRWPDRRAPFFAQELHGLGFTYAFWFVPYWSIILPLTLLSAWLVLSKPRSTKPPTQQPT